MSFNIFGPATKDTIRVGYISTERGFVDGISICEANDYAKANPGTQFVFKTRNFIKYLNINEVNKLTPDDIVSSGSTCSGIKFDTLCGPAKAYFYGGGGVGVQGNPVIGQDGSLLAIDLIHGGYGYQYPPIVEVKDNCGIGAGAVIRAILGDIVETFETYATEEDFEEYELCEPTDVGYGLRYSPDGKFSSVWDPSLYANITSENPIDRQIKEYQEFLEKLSTPWWTTRKKNPLRVTSGNRTTRIKHNVTDTTFVQRQIKDGVKNPITWSDFLNSYAISPVPPSNAVGSDFSGQEFTFEWEEEFPYTGEYVFRGQADNLGRFYLDNQKLLETGEFRQDQTPKKIVKTVKAGVHRIRVDLYNQPVTTVSPQVRNVFNTVDYISKANRRLWRTNVYGRGGFINQYGVCPFDTTVELADNPYAGVHTIIWDNIDFPVDGNYTIEIEVDDNVKLTFVGQGEETVITKRGFSSGDRSTGKSTETRFFKAGKYKIVADLEQIPGGRFAFSAIKGINPMALAINIQSSAASQTSVVSPKSWNENPMGVALTIDAPEPPIPQEPAPQQEGRCPPNPIWSTRLPNAREKWYPVTYTDKMREANRLSGASEWTAFMKRYAMSPVKPSDAPGSDGSGVIFTNSWEIDIPYDGFYSFAVQKTDTTRLYVDGNLAFDLKTVGDDVWKDLKNKPKFKKVFISKGRHTIGIEVENNVETVDTFKEVRQVIFRTADWFSTSSLAAKAVDVDFNLKTSAESLFTHIFKIPDLDINITKPVKTSINQNISKKIEVGKVYTIEIEVPNNKPNPNPFSNFNNPLRGGSITLEARGNTLVVEDFRVEGGENYRDLWFTANNGRFFDIKNGTTKATCKFVVDPSPSSSETTKNGITYIGPPLFHHQDKRWGEFMNRSSVSPFLPPINDENPQINGVKTYLWQGVNFPESGQYDIAFQADNDATLIINGVKVLPSRGYEGSAQFFKVNVTKGKYDVLVECNNVPDRTNIFNNNPTGFAVIIRKDVKVKNTQSKSWVQNPVAVSATLIPPPCPKRIKGRGVVTEVVVDDPGNGYPSPGGGDYPVALRLKSIIVEEPGINYRCGEDQIQITPNNGAVLDYKCDTFGRIIEVIVSEPGEPIVPIYPEITIPSETGINARFRPTFEIIRDPVTVPLERLIQVTDLVGLKQTGYVEGRPYYGAVFYKDGVRYAGYYETVGDLVQVYDTLQESIDAQVTTPPSAIQRQGTDVQSNNPRLNIPGTPENLI